MEEAGDIAGILELSHQEFKTIIINMPRALMDKVHSMKEQMGNASREMKISRINQKKC